MVQDGSVPGGDDAAPKGGDPGQRVLALPADLRTLDRAAAAGPDFVQTFEETLFEGGEGFGGGGHGGG